MYHSLKYHKVSEVNSWLILNIFVISVRQCWIHNKQFNNCIESEIGFAKTKYNNIYFK